MKIKQKLDEMKPALREWAWLLSEKKETEEKFVDDMVHRMTLLLEQLLAEREKEITHQWNKCEQKLDGTTQGAIKCIEAFRSYLSALNQNQV